MLPRLAVIVFVATLVTPAASYGADDDPFQALVRTTDPLSPEEERARLRVPEGFELQLFAAEPEINKPMNLGFDARGRVWVTSTVEYPFPADKQRWTDAEGTRVRDSRDAIKILEDTNGDGRSDRVTTFIDGLNIPIGILPYGNGCIAWSIPNIWYFEDTDGDDRCDRQTILFGPLGYERDTHGNVASMRLGDDGWVYATHGFNNISRFEVRPEHLGPRQLGDPGTVLEVASGNVFRFRPDGSQIELWSRGQVNPFGLAFDGWGNLYSADCHSDPVTHLLRGACYPSFGRPHDGLGFGPVMCRHRHNSTGLCGIVYLDGGVWGPEWNDHVLIGNCVTSRVNHDRVTFAGSTPVAHEAPDFIVPEDPWFRPVDLRLGPDGALYIADFYNRIIGHYEVDLHHPGRDRQRGRIWRVVPNGPLPPRAAPSQSELLARDWRWQVNNQPRWTAAQHRSALVLTADASIDPRVRRMAAEGLVDHLALDNLGPLLQLHQAVPAGDAALRHTLRIALRNHLAQTGGIDALAAIVSPSQASDDLVAIVRAVNTPEAAVWLFDWLDSTSKRPPELAALCTTLARYLPPDRQAALIQTVRRRFETDSAALLLPLLKGLRDGFAQRGVPPVEELSQWARVIAQALLLEAEQLPDAQWIAAPLPDHPHSPNPWLNGQWQCDDGRQAALLSSRPNPGGADWESRVGTLASREFACPAKLDFWIAGHRGPPRSAPHDKNLVRLVDAATGAELKRAYPPRNDTAQRVRWDLSEHAGRLVHWELVDGDDARAYAWLAVGRFEPQLVAGQLSSLDERLTTVAELAREFRMDDCSPRLAVQLSRRGLLESTQLALAAAVAQSPDAAPALAALFRTAPGRLQAQLAELLSASRLGARLLCEVAPPRLLTQPAVALRLAALKDSELDARVAALTENLPSAAQELDEQIRHRHRLFESARRAGAANAEAGRQLFVKHCSACHRVGGVGESIAPQLDGLANRGAERLCEDILDPNRAVDPNFLMHALELTNGTIVAGLLRREEAAALVIVDQQGREHTVPLAEIADRTRGTLSLMPSGYGKLLSDEEFAHLLAWLLSR